MNNSKVLVLNKGYYPWTGGIETVVRQIAAGANGGHLKVEVLACHQNITFQKKVEDFKGIKVTKVPTLGSAISTPISPSYYWEFYKRKKDFDIIHLHTPFLLGEMALALMGLSNRQKLLITFHADPQLTRWSKLYEIYSPVFNKVLEIADKIVVTAPNNKKNFPSLNEFQEKTSVIPLAPDSLPEKKINLSLKRKVIEKFNIPPDDNLVLFVGRLASYKGLDYLIRSFKSVNATLLIVGSGPLKESLIKLTHQLGLNKKVIFTGFVDDNLLPAFYSLSDIFVLPSVNEGEAFGIVQVEALNFGLPIVNTNLKSGVPFVSKDGETGLTVEPKNSDALADAINCILFSDDLYRKFSSNALKRAAIFTLEKMINKYEDIYRDLALY